MKKLPAPASKAKNEAPATKVRQSTPGFRRLGLTRAPIAAPPPPVDASTVPIADALAGALSPADEDLAEGMICAIDDFAMVVHYALAGEDFDPRPLADTCYRVSGLAKATLGLYQRMQDSYESEIEALHAQLAAKAVA